MVLQKLFSAFPGGWPGLGLLLLRGLVGFTLIAHSLAYVRSTNLSFIAGLVITLAFASAACLLAGFMTPIFAALVGLGGVAAALCKVLFLTQNLFETNHGSIDLMVVAIAIALVGPGAFSLDARMFGRREIRIPAAPKSSES